VGGVKELEKSRRDELWMQEKLEAKDGEERKK